MRYVNKRLRPLVVIALTVIMAALVVRNANRQGTPPTDVAEDPGAGFEGDFVGGVFCGTVIDLTPETLTVKGDGVGKGKIIQGEYRFAASDYIRTGIGEPLHALAYRLIDLQRGDRVFVKYDRVRGLDTCTTLAIQRRPGGRVPPNPGEPVNRRNRYHDFANAKQDFEEKGIPIPQRFIVPNPMKQDPGPEI
jgi:hypothetical protein